MQRFCPDCVVRTTWLVYLNQHVECHVYSYDVASAQSIPENTLDVLADLVSLVWVQFIKLYFHNGVHGGPRKLLAGLWNLDTLGVTRKGKADFASVAGKIDVERRASR